MKDNYLETPYYVAELQEKILLVTFKPLLHINLEDAKAIVAQRVGHFGDSSIAVLFNNVKVKSITKEARNFLFNEGLVNIRALAFINEHDVDETLSTYLFGFVSPKVPCKVFTTEQEAKDWLRLYV